MSIIKTYLNSKFRWRLLIDVVLFSLFAFFLWTQSIDMLLPLGLMVVGIAIFEALVFFRKYITPIVLTIGFVAGVSYFSYASFALLTSYDMSSIATNYFIAAWVGIFGIIGAVIAVFGAYYFGKGRIWFNLTLAYLMYFVGFIATGAIAPNLSPIVYSMVGTALIVVVITLKSIFPKTKKFYYNLNELPNNRQTTSVKLKIEKLLLNTDKTNTNINVFDTELSSRIFFVKTSYALIAVLPLAPENGLAMRKNKLELDGEEITWALESFMDTVAKYSNKNKIPLKYITPLIYVSNNNYLGTEIAQISIAHRQQPERVRGSVYITSQKGFVALLNRFKNNSKKLPASVLEAV